MTSSQVPEPIDERNLPRSYDDVRQWLDLVESMGELKRIDGADWDLEIGTMAEHLHKADEASRAIDPDLHGRLAREHALFEALRAEAAAGRTEPNGLVEIGLRALTDWLRY